MAPFQNLLTNQRPKHELEIFFMKNQTKHSKPPKKFSQPYSQSFSSRHSLKSMHEYSKRFDGFSKCCYQLALSLVNALFCPNFGTKGLILASFEFETFKKVVLKIRLKPRSAWSIYFRFDTSLVSSIDLTNTDNSSIDRFKEHLFVLKAQLNSRRDG